MTQPGLYQRARGCASRLTECLTTDSRLVVQLAVWRLSLPLLKRVIKLSTLAELMSSSPAAPLDESQRRQRVGLVQRFVARGGRLLVSRNCLERSLLLYRLLSQADARPVLVLGARKDGSSVAGHAWVELDGDPIFEPDRDEYVPIVTFGLHGSVTRASELRIPA